VHVPLIIFDPDEQADHTRNSVDDRLVEAIDLAPTFVEAVGGVPPDHILEGRSLLGATRGSDDSTANPWRTAAISECDYAFRVARVDLKLAADEAHGYMLRTDRWKYMLFEPFRPQLFDLQNDPHELADLGEDIDTAGIRDELHEQLFAWSRTRKMRTTIPNSTIERSNDGRKRNGFIFGVW
jgi:arylsulfatase A-like enzyme